MSNCVTSHQRSCRSMQISAWGFPCNATPMRLCHYCWYQQWEDTVLIDAHSPPSQVDIHDNIFTKTSTNNPGKIIPKIPTVRYKYHRDPGAWEQEVWDQNDHNQWGHTRRWRPLEGTLSVMQVCKPLLHHFNVFESAFKRMLLSI